MRIERKLSALAAAAVVVAGASMPTGAEARNGRIAAGDWTRELLHSPSQFTSEGGKVGAAIRLNLRHRT